MLTEHVNTSFLVFLTTTSLAVGYYVGAFSRTRRLRRKNTSSFDDQSRDPTEDTRDGPSEAVMTGDCKMVLVVRTDLGMSAGKIAAQCSHAALSCYQDLAARKPAVGHDQKFGHKDDPTNPPHAQLLRQWERTGQTKVALKCDNEEQLLLLQKQAQSLKLCARSIQDAGRTQIAAGSRTVLGIVGPSKLINQVTGRLRLL